MSNETILANIYLWEDEDENGTFSYYGWRILGGIHDETLQGCSGYATQWDALDALNEAIARNKEFKGVK